MPVYCQCQQSLQKTKVTTVICTHTYTNTEVQACHTFTVVSVLHVVLLGIHPTIIFLFFDCGHYYLQSQIPLPYLFSILPVLMQLLAWVCVYKQMCNDSSVHILHRNTNIYRLSHMQESMAKQMKATWGMYYEYVTESYKGLGTLNHFFHLSLLSAFIFVYQLPLQSQYLCTIPKIIAKSSTVDFMECLYRTTATMAFLCNHVSFCLAPIRERSPYYYTMLPPYEP